MMESVVDSSTALLLIIASSFIAIAYAFSSKQDSREPPLIPSSIPYIGHLLGLIRNGPKYYASISAKYPFPIYKLKMLGADTIIVNSPELTTAVQRNTKTMSFAPLIMDFTARVTRPSKVATDLLLDNLNGEDGKPSLMKDMTKAMHGALAVGADLDRMNESMVDSLSRQIDNLELLAESGPIRLFEWTRHCITLASTEATYGPKNPFKDPAVEQAFWETDDNIAMILLNFMPYLTARKGHNARKTVQTGFTKYFQSNGHEQGSALIQARYDTNTKYGVPIHDMGNFELGLAIGLLVNTAPAAFWTLLNVFSNPPLLEELRSELSAVVVTTPSNNTATPTPTHHLNITRAIESSPLLLSLFQETLRLQSNVGSARKVLKDTLLDNHYLLKKDSTVQMPSKVLHFSPAVWGPDPDSFNAKRFLRPAPPQKQESNPQQPPQKALKPPTPGSLQIFGGGVSLCPGRHFATCEVLAFLVMFVLRFDIVPVASPTPTPNAPTAPTTKEGSSTAPTTKDKEKSVWPILHQDKVQLSTSIGPPDTDILVHVKRRKGEGGGGWRVSVGRG